MVFRQQADDYGGAVHLEVSTEERVVAEQVYCIDGRHSSQGLEGRHVGAQYQRHHSCLALVAGDDYQAAMGWIEMVVVPPEPRPLEGDLPGTSWGNRRLGIELGIDLVGRMDVGCGPDGTFGFVDESDRLSGFDLDSFGVELTVSKGNR